ncbi:MAG TPA: hypothetical protein DD417_16545 [Elusimicrobia bacterium]|nr:hypothetical protein [Elusimicrobiota bacterium]
MAIFPKSVARKFDGGDVVTIVGPEAYFNGSLTVRGSVRVEGEVEGNIHEAHTVIIGHGGRVKGDVCAEHVVVGGSVEGDIIAATQLELIAGGRIIGDIRTPKLLIEDGATFEGACLMHTGKEGKKEKETGSAPADEAESEEEPLPR